MKIVTRITFVFPIDLCVIFLRTENFCARGRIGRRVEKYPNLIILYARSLYTRRQTVPNSFCYITVINKFNLVMGTELNMTLNVKL